MVTSDLHTRSEGELIDVYNLRQTCDAYPSQWEGQIGEAGSIYIRYRWGILSARISRTASDAARRDEIIFDKDIGRETGDQLGGMLETQEMQEILRGVCRFQT
jgi:hypothetical protein